jgi:hypothetical protein
VESRGKNRKGYMKVFVRCSLSILVASVDCNVLMVNCVVATEKQRFDLPHCLIIKLRKQYFRTDSVCVCCECFSLLKSGYLIGEPCRFVVAKPLLDLHTFSKWLYLL